MSQGVTEFPEFTDYVGHGLSFPLTPILSLQGERIFLIFFPRFKVAICDLEHPYSHP